MLKNYVQTGTVTKGEKGAVSAPQVRFIRRRCTSYFAALPQNAS
jgi:hypothetical protein